MDIADIVSEEYVETDVGTPVSKLRGMFEDPTLKAVLVTDGDELAGIVTRRQLASSHEQPSEKARSIVWHVPRVSRTADVREVARLMVGSDTKVLPVVENDTLKGVVTADDLLELVSPYLDVISVADVYTSDLVTVGSDTTVGQALHLFREHRITHLPVVDGDDPVGIVSLTDIIGFTTRAGRQSRGGVGGGFDAHGGAGSSSGFRTHGGFGAREGDRERLLDLPVADVMSEPVGTVAADVPLGEAVQEMFDRDVSSLVVVDSDGHPTGIVTKTDVLESLTWTDEGRRAVQLRGADLLDDMTYDDVASLIDDLAEKYPRMTILEARVELHEHDEMLRGVPLLMATIRLYTDKGRFMASDEGYGARHALHLARNAVERQLLEGKTRRRRGKKHPDAEYWEKYFGWWLSG